MKCIFCQQEATPIPSTFSSTGDIVDTQLTQCCKECSANYYLHFETKEIYAYCFGYQDYYLWFYIKNHKMFPGEFHLTKRNVEKLGYEDVMQLQCLPNITPQNVKDKLPTLLTFM